jgi:hypothetical protein
VIRRLDRERRQRAEQQADRERPGEPHDKRGGGHGQPTECASFFGRWSRSDDCSQDRCVSAALSRLRPAIGPDAALVELFEEFGVAPR